MVLVGDLSRREAIRDEVRLNKALPKMLMNAGVV